MERSCKYCGKRHPLAHTCAHKPVQVQSAAARRDVREVSFRNTKRWQRKRDEIRERDRNLCRVCLERGVIIYDRLSVHHIVPLSENWETRLDNDNLLTLCSQCHAFADVGRLERGTLLDIARSTPDFAQLVPSPPICG